MAIVGFHFWNKAGLYPIHLVDCFAINTVTVPHGALDIDTRLGDCHQKELELAFCTFAQFTHLLHQFQVSCHTDVIFVRINSKLVPKQLTQ